MKSPLEILREKIFNNQIGSKQTLYDWIEEAKKVELKNMEIVFNEAKLPENQVKKANEYLCEKMSLQPTLFEDVFNNVGIEKLDEKVLDYLNKIKPAKRDFGKSKHNLKDIKARIREKYSFDDFKKVVDHFVNKWKENAEMKRYIRPSTLFGEKFDQYLTEANEKGNSNDGSGNFVFNIQDEAVMK